MVVREPDFAGSWYPAERAECLQVFASYERQCVPRKSQDPAQGGIVPHAGWVFSGQLAYNAIRELARSQKNKDVDTVLLLGGHLHPSSSVAIMARGGFWTPLGTIPTDEELAAALLSANALKEIDPERHTPDNTVELQAPFIKHLFPQAKLVVLAAPPRAESLDLARSAVRLAREMGRTLAVVGSTDLTHYGPNYGWAPHGQGDRALQWVREENDRRFIDVACRLEPTAMLEEALERSNACCPGAAAAAVAAGLELGATAGELLRYSTSADVRPDASFVGYAAIVF